jgi:alcohol dehydrogenase class IV
MMTVDAGLGSGVREFHASLPTRLVGGSGVAAQVGRYAVGYGDRALVVVGDDHARASGLLARVTASLQSEGACVELVEGIGPNPSVATVDAGAALARAWRADVVLGLGGGSVLDVAKAIATAAAARDPETFAHHLSGLRRPGLLLVDSVLPVIALPTLPGSGSESNGTSVITDDASGRKLSAHSDLAAPRIALLDPELLRDAPAELLGPGLADGFCHALEAALSSSSTIASDALAEQAMRMLLRLGPAPLRERGDDEGTLAAWWATNLAGQALTLAGSIVTHPLAHPLSARLDARHGAAVAALEPAVLASFRDRFLESGSATKVGRWLDVRGAAKDPEAALRGVLTKLLRYCSSLGVTGSIVDLGVRQELVSELVRDARASGSRGLRNLPGEEPTPEELFAVFDVALRHGPASSASALLSAASSASTPSA